jgi:AraC-like DNA-binding protein
MGAASIGSSSAAWIKGVVNMFAFHGVDPDRLFRAAGLDIGRLREPHMRFTSLEVSRLWNVALEWTGEPALGLDTEEARRFVNFDISAHAMWPGPTLADGLQGLSRYLHLIEDVAMFDVQPVLEGAWVHILNGAADDAPRQRIEFGVLALMMLCRHVTGVHALKPLQMEFFSPDPPDFHPYRRAFGCPLRFGQPAMRLLLANETLALPLARTTSPHDLQEHVLERRLARMGHQRMSYQASVVIIHGLQDGEPTPTTVARELGLTEKAMAQRLKAEQTNWDRLLDECRDELARAYLGDANYAIARIPALLGYNSAADFNAACRRWFGMQPAHFRAFLQLG